MATDPKNIKLKRQFDKMSYTTTTALAARTGFERNDRYEAEVKRVDEKVADLIYQQQNNTTLLHDGVICVFATSDANQEGSKWVRKDAKSTGTFNVPTGVEVESGAEVIITNVLAPGIFLGKKYHFQKVASLSEATLELIEKPIITEDNRVTIKLKNTKDGISTAEGDTVYNWCEL